MPSLGITPAAATSTTRIENLQGFRALNLKELWSYRELIWFLALRDIQVRYKQTLLGAAWAVIQPVVNTLIFTLVFNRLAGIGSGSAIPYPLVTFATLLPWQLFESGVGLAANSLVGSQHLITKVYFPRLAVPLAAVGSALVDFLIGCAALFLFVIGYAIAGYTIQPTWRLLLLPPIIVMSLGTVIGTGLWLSAVNVQFRDVRYVVPFLLRVWLFVTPIVYPASEVPPKWQFLFGLNPMAGIVAAYRWALLGDSAPSAALICSSTFVMVAVLISGLFYFRRTEKTFADVV